jgi:hypothetical protein
MMIKASTVVFSSAKSRAATRRNSVFAERNTTLTGTRLLKFFIDSQPRRVEMTTGEANGATFHRLHHSKLSSDGDGPSGASK